MAIKPCNLDAQRIPSMTSRVDLRHFHWQGWNWTTVLQEAHEILGTWDLCVILGCGTLGESRWGWLVPLISLVGDIAWCFQVSLLPCIANRKFHLHRDNSEFSPLPPVSWHFWGWGFQCRGWTCGRLWHGWRLSVPNSGTIALQIGPVARPMVWVSFPLHSCCKQLHEVHRIFAPDALHM